MKILALLSSTVTSCLAADQQPILDIANTNYNPQQYVALGGQANQLCYYEEIIDIAKKPFNQRGRKNFRQEISPKLNIFESIMGAGDTFVFGCLVQKNLHLEGGWSQEKKDRMQNGYQKFNDLFGNCEDTLVNFGQLKKLIDQRILADSANLSDEMIVSLANAFRHLCHASIEGYTTDFGDYAAEYILTALINKIESRDVEISDLDKELLSAAYYQLSQTYTHLLVFESKTSPNIHDSDLCRITYSNLNGYCQYPEIKVLNFDISYSSILAKRCDLLRQAIIYNPKNDQAWVRIAELCDEMQINSASYHPTVIKTLRLDKTLLKLDKAVLSYILVQISRADKNADCHFVNKEALSLIKIIRKLKSNAVVKKSNSTPEKQKLEAVNAKARKDNTKKTKIEEDSIFNPKKRKLVAINADDREDDSKKLKTEEVQTENKLVKDKP